MTTTTEVSDSLDRVESIINMLDEICDHMDGFSSAEEAWLSSITETLRTWRYVMQECAISNYFARHQRPPSTRRLLFSERVASAMLLFDRVLKSSPVKRRKLADFSAIPVYECTAYCCR